MMAAPRVPTIARAAPGTAYKIVVGKSVNNLGYQLGGWSVSWQGGSGTTTTGTTFWQALQQATAASGDGVHSVPCHTAR
jgi:beta-glucosidase